MALSKACNRFTEVSDVCDEEGNFLIVQFQIKITTKYTIGKGNSGGSCSNLFVLKSEFNKETYEQDIINHIELDIKKGQYTLDEIIIIDENDMVPF